MAIESLATRWVRAIAISTAAAAAVCLGAVLWAGRTEVTAALRMISFDTLIGLLGLALINYCLRFVRWHYYLHTLGSLISIRHDLRIYIGGFALTTTPGKAGEMARSLWLQPYGVPATSSLAAFLSERLQDFLAVMLLASLGVSLFQTAKWPLLVSLGLVFAAVLSLYFPAIMRAVLSAKPDRPGRLFALVRRVLDILTLTRRCLTPTRLIIGLLIGIGAWGAEAFGLYIIMQAMGYPLPLVTAASVYALSMLAGALSFMPGGLGGSEAMMFILLKLLNVPTPIAVSATLLIRLTTLWFAVVLGIIALSIRTKIPPLAAPATSG